MLRTILVAVAAALSLASCGPVEPSNNMLAITTITDPTVPQYVDTMREIDKKIAARLLPGDSMFVTSVAANSRQDTAPLLFPARPARNQAETANFLTARESFVKSVDDWHTRLVVKPPTRSDIFPAIAVGADQLHSSGRMNGLDSPHKIEIIMSDMQDNITRGRAFTTSLDGIDLLVLFAFPPSQAPADYEPFRQQLTRTLQASHPRSLRILFPSEALAFNITDYLAESRR